jgi:WD40 repeat-containing protein SMU1
MRSGAPDRFARLERLLQRNEFAPADAYLPGWSKERKRSVIAAEMKDDVTSAPASRLLALLTDALKWQAHTGRLPREAFSTAPAGVSAGGGAVSSGSGEVLGSGIDLLTGAAVSAAAAAEQPTTALSRTLRLGAVGSGTNAEVCTFTPNGALLVTGSSDGFIESWDWTTGALAKELPYQAADELLLHDDAVSALAFSADGELLASASVRGDVKVWRYYTGEALRKFPTAHPGAVASLAFSPDGTQVLTAGHDGVARILGLRSGNTVKEFRGHKVRLRFCSDLFLFWHVLSHFSHTLFYFTLFPPAILVFPVIGTVFRRWFPRFYRVHRRCSQDLERHLWRLRSDLGAGRAPRCCSCAGAPRRAAAAGASDNARRGVSAYPPAA